LDQGFAVIDEARHRLGARRKFAGEHVLDLAEARWRIETGELRRASNLLGRIRPDAPQLGMLRARLDLAHGRPDVALSWLDDYRPPSLRDALVSKLVRARALLELDADASATISEAVEMSIEERFAMIFLEEGRAIARHARVAAQALGTPGGGALAAALGAPVLTSKVHPPVIVLSQREDAVLRFLPSRLTNKEIARECFMSVNTVKTHLKSIYAKLGASTRSEAIDEARRLNLL